MLISVEGVFMGANLRQQVFEGNTRTSVMLDLYVPECPLPDKAVSVRCDDINLLQLFQNNFSIGDFLTVRCTLSAFANRVYFRYVDHFQKKEMKAS